MVLRLMQSDQLLAPQLAWNIRVVGRGDPQVRAQDALPSGAAVARTHDGSDRRLRTRTHARSSSLNSEAESTTSPSCGSG
ncbi:hypothetical protein ACFYWX_36610 [Streptomyces sp. NPDC002888]|uniref:hypothetical protein n=1 Tax=Streptomyces sp. NPDC002888 TaxID=3364668 RepID=UPI00368E85D4